MPKEALPLPTDPAKRCDALTDALCAAIGALAVGDPHGARDAVQSARDRLDGAEAVAIRAALERSHWRVQPAAALLGYPRHQALVKLLEPGRRHEAIGAEVARHREESGYHRGHPPAAAAPAPETGQDAPPRRRQNAPRG